MKYERMKMPDSTARLIGMSLDMLELQPFKLDDETIAFTVEYESGSEPIFMIRTVVQVSWFTKKPAIAIIAASPNENINLGKVHLRKFVSAPTHPSDVLFMTELGMHIKSIAWAIAATENIGECVTFPGRPMNPSRKLDD